MVFKTKRLDEIVKGVHFLGRIWWGRGKKEENQSKKIKKSDPVSKEENLEILVCLRQMKSAAKMVVSLCYKMLMIIRDHFNCDESGFG